MKRYNTISNIPGVMQIVDYEDTPYSSDMPSVVDKKYFIPLSQQTSGIFRSVDPNEFTLKNGVDDGRDISLRRRGLDLSQKTQTLQSMVDKAASAKADIEKAVARAKASVEKQKSEEKQRPDDKE